MRSRVGTRKWKRGTTSQQIMENPYALGVLHALNVCDTVRTLLGVETCKKAVKSDSDPEWGAHFFTRELRFHRGLS
jgi:hypothetical protein